jgi:hypothetical protein
MSKNITFDQTISLSNPNNKLVSPNAARAMQGSALFCRTNTIRRYGSMYVPNDRLFVNINRTSDS